MTYASKSKDVVRAYNAAYYVNHQDELLARRIDHYAESRDEVCAKAREYTEMMAAIRSTLTCNACGGSADLFHHVDPSTKRFNISEASTYSFCAVEAELAKCIPMCKPCHARLHNPKKTIVGDEKPKGIQNG